MNPVRLSLEREDKLAWRHSAGEAMFFNLAAYWNHPGSFQMTPAFHPWRVGLNCSGETLSLGISQALQLILEYSGIATLN